MKETLKQVAWLFITLGCLIIQIIALMFAGIGWVFNRLADVLSNMTHFIMDKYQAKTEEEIPTEEVPT